MAPWDGCCRLILAGHETTRLFVCLSREFLAGRSGLCLAQVPVGLLFLKPKWLLMKLVGLAWALSKPRPDQTLLLLPWQPHYICSLWLPNLVTVGKNMR